MGWVTTTTHYEVVKHQIVKAGKCVECGKRMRRQITIQRTVNPWNVHKEGEFKGCQKTRHEVWLDCLDECKTWKENHVLRCASHV